MIFMLANSLKNPITQNEGTQNQNEKHILTKQQKYQNIKSQEKLRDKQ